jgi:hypothetical protein
MAYWTQRAFTKEDKELHWRQTTDTAAYRHGPMDTGNATSRLRSRANEVTTGKDN